MNKNSALFGMIASSIFVVMGAIMLLVLSAEGTMQLEGLGIGAVYGLWLELAYLIGRAIYAKKKSVAAVLLFMGLMLVLGLVFHATLQRPYIVAHRTMIGFLEQILGMVWALGFAAIFLSYESYRRAEE